MHSCYRALLFVDAEPGLLMVNPVWPCLKIDDVTTGWEYFRERGWDVVVAPHPVVTKGIRLQFVIIKGLTLRQ